MTVPDGWVLVPREPTDEMRAAAGDVSWTDGPVGAQHPLRRQVGALMYERMLAAAPPPPARPPGDWTAVRKVPTPRMLAAGLRDADGFNMLGISEEALAAAFKRMVEAVP